MDIMDIMRPHGEYTATGRFYKTRPLNHNAGGVSFYFAYVEPRSRAFARLFSNVIGEESNIAIRTNAKIDPVPGESFIRTPDGQLYLVNQVMIDNDKAPKQAMRIFKRPSGIELLIRMVPVSDPLSDEL